MARLEGYAGDSCWGERGFGGGDFVDGGHVCFWGCRRCPFRISAIRAKVARFDPISTGDKISGPPQRSLMSPT